MTKGDIVTMPSGKPAQYLGGSLYGAEFVYLDANGQPAKHRGVPDSFCIDSVRLLAKLQPEVSRV